MITPRFSAILTECGIFDYFVFPSISWESKGPRVARIIENIQLRAATVMFIDDNHLNRAEVLSCVPGIQIADETFVEKILADARFKGKDDSDLSRLKQYKLLERRFSEAEKVGGENAEFLRKCDIRVFIDYNVEENIDRAVELINRTNQLNFTKRRLSEDPARAASELKEQLKPFDRQAGLIKVADKYGDYGFVGFFLTGGLRKVIVKGAANNHLVHFCFSCRTLGMSVETWLYQHLGRPELTVVGDVVTDLFAPGVVDWVQLIDHESTVGDVHSVISDKLVLYGGCEAHLLGVYLKRRFNDTAVYGNFAANGLFLRINRAEFLIDMCDRDPAVFSPESDLLGLPNHLMCHDIFSAEMEGTSYVLNLTPDANRHARVRHRRHHWTLALELRAMAGFDLAKVADQDLIEHLQDGSFGYDDERRAQLLKVHEHMKENYEWLARPTHDDVFRQTQELIERIPRGGRLVFAVNHSAFRKTEGGQMGTVVEQPQVSEYLNLLRSVAANYDYVGVVSVSDVIVGDHDLRGADHYTREVYLRFSELLENKLESVRGRIDAPSSKHEIKLHVERSAAQRARRAEVEELVSSVYQTLLRRSPEVGGLEHYAGRILSGAITPAHFIRSIVASQEFRNKWTPMISGRPIQELLREDS